MSIATPTQKDLDERIDGDLPRLTLEAIKKDTEKLLSDFEWTIVRCTVQAQIYRDLLKRIDERIIERDLRIP